LLPDQLLAVCLRTFTYSISRCLAGKLPFLLAESDPGINIPELLLT